MLVLEKIKNALNKENANSILIALLCMSGLISFVTNIDNIIPVIIIAVLIILELINAKDTLRAIRRGKFVINIFFIAFALLILLFFIISILNNGLREVITERFKCFIGFIVLPYLCCRHKVKINNLIKSILIVSGILAIPLFFKNLGGYASGTRMAISYYMLPVYIAFFMLFFLERHYDIKKKIIIVLIGATLFYPYWFFLFGYASRGVFLAIFACVVLCIMQKISVKSRIILIIALTIITVIWIFLQGPILKGVETILGNFNIRISAISKNVSLYEKGKIDNGRNNVFNQAIEGIIKHPIIGNGIGDYADKYVTYPHNILLQAWYEGGILFFALMTLILLYSMYIVIFDKNTESGEKYLLIFFFAISIIRLMLSYEFWKDLSFGMYLYFVLYAMLNNWNIKRGIRNGNSNNTNVQKR